MAQPDYRYTIAPSRAKATAAAPPIRPDMIFGKDRSYVIGREPGCCCVRVSS
jgi:hypothetical protein